MCDRHHCSSRAPASQVVREPITRRAYSSPYKSGVAGSTRIEARTTRVTHTRSHVTHFHTRHRSSNDKLMLLLVLLLHTLHCLVPCLLLSLSSALSFALMTRTARRALLGSRAGSSALLLLLGATEMIRTTTTTNESADGSATAVTDAASTRRHCHRCRRLDRCHQRCE